MSWMSLPATRPCADVAVRGEIAIDVDVLRGPGRGELDDLVLRDLIGAAVDVLPDGHVLSGQEHGCGCLNFEARHRALATSSFMISFVPP